MRHRRLYHRRGHDLRAKNSLIGQVPTLIDAFTFEHVNAVWDHVADCKVTARYEVDEEIIDEILWAQRLGTRYMLCSIPAFVYGLAMGDIVTLNESNTINGVWKRSGRSAFRMWSKGGWSSKVQILDRIAELGGIMEECTIGLTAVDAADTNAGWAIWDFLVEMQRNGQLEHEAGFWAGTDIRPN